MKRVIRLRNKETGRVDTYPTLSDLIERNGSEVLGISRHALYNAMHTGKGFWENKRYQIYYEDIDLGKNLWGVEDFQKIQ